MAVNTWYITKYPEKFHLNKTLARLWKKRRKKKKLNWYLFCDPLFNVSFAMLTLVTHL